MKSHRSTFEFNHLTIKSITSQMSAPIDEYDSRNYNSYINDNPLSQSYSQVLQMVLSSMVSLSIKVDIFHC